MELQPVSKKAAFISTQTDDAGYSRESAAGSYADSLLKKEMAFAIKGLGNTASRNTPKVSNKQK